MEQTRHPGFKHHWDGLSWRQRWIVRRIAFAGQRADDAGTAWLVTNFVHRELGRSWLYLLVAGGLGALGLILGITADSWVLMGSGLGLVLGHIIRVPRYELAEERNAAFSEEFDATA